jgi:hypothetical protein
MADNPDVPQPLVAAQARGRACDADAGRTRAGPAGAACRHSGRRGRAGRAGHRDARRASVPPVESLTLASDFKPFLSAKVDESVKREALRKLFTDPHFNVMDGLDTYIDDYSKPDPMPEGLLDKLADVYKSIEEKAAEAAPSDTATEAPAARDEPSTKAEKDTDERQG